TLDEQGEMMWQMLKEVGNNTYNYSIGEFARTALNKHATIRSILQELGVNLTFKRKFPTISREEIESEDEEFPIPTFEDSIRIQSIHPKISFSSSCSGYISTLGALRAEARDLDRRGKRVDWFKPGSHDRKAASASYIKLFETFLDIFPFIKPILDQIGIIITEDKVILRDFDIDIEKCSPTSLSSWLKSFEFKKKTLISSINPIPRNGFQILEFFCSIMVERALQLKSRHEENGRAEYSRWNRSAGIPISLNSTEAFAMFVSADLILNTIAAQSSHKESSSPLLIVILRNIAELTYSASQGDTNTECKNLMLQIISLSSLIHGSKHPITAEQFLATGLMLRELGDVENGVRWTRKAFSAYSDLFGIEDYHTIFTYHVLLKLEVSIDSGFEKLTPFEMKQAIDTIEWTSEEEFIWK
ncbi:hypothetical protein ADUPG1_009866, partial [Aduncisulcus paluster]